MEPMADCKDQPAKPLIHYQSPIEAGKTGPVEMCVTFMLTNVIASVTNEYLAHLRDVFSRHTWIRGECGSRGRICTPHSGGFGGYARPALRPVLRGNPLD